MSDGVEPGNPIDESEESTKEEGEAKEDGEPCMQNLDNDNNFISNNNDGCPDVFPRWENSWELGNTNEASLSRGEYSSKRNKGQYKGLGQGKHRPRKQVKAQKVFVSGLGHARAKKRIRVDGVFYSDPEGSQGGREGNNSNIQRMETGIIDLNLNLNSPTTGNAVSEEAIVEPATDEVREIGLASVSILEESSRRDEETEATVLLATKLGVNLEGHINHVRDSILDEGLQVGKP
ncbi:hypothetical protein Hanom_Chr16g01514361 [Helianthus anomalus]